MAVGTVIALPFSGILAQGMGWEWIFYIQGGLSLIWCVAWIFLVYDSPQEHPRIHPVELQMFEETMPNGGGHGAKHAVSDNVVPILAKFHCDWRKFKSFVD